MNVCHNNLHIRRHNHVPRLQMTGEVALSTRCSSRVPCPAYDDRSSSQLYSEFGVPGLVIVRAPSPRFTRDGDAFGIGLMAWPPVKLDLTSSFRLLAIAPAYSQTHHLQLSASTTSAYPIQRAFVKVSFVALLPGRTTIPHAGKSTC